MILYLFKTVLCLTLFLGAYYLLLQNEKMYRFNRWYLLGSIVISFGIPFLLIAVPDPVPAFSAVKDAVIPVLSGPLEIRSMSVEVNTPNYFSQLAAILYLLITAVLLARFARNIYKIRIKISHNKKIAFQGSNMILLDKVAVPHTFLNNIFVSKDAFEKGNIEEEILVHELTHARERHSLDIIFIELLSVFFWCNPLLRLYKRAIVMNHEFLADSKVLESSENIRAYQLLLLSKIDSISNPPLTTSFNFSLTKKRLIMMKKSTNPKTIFLKTLLLIPIVASAILLFSDKAEAKILETIENKMNPAGTIKTRIKQNMNIAGASKLTAVQTESAGSNEIENENIAAQLPTIPADDLAADKSKNGIGISEGSVWLSINHRTTKAQLTNYIKMLKEVNITLEVSDNEYDAKGQLKYLKIKVTCPGEKTGTMAQTVDADYGVGFLYHSPGEGFSGGLRMSEK